jgi:outer membrane cobalamin receptor
MESFRLRAVLLLCFLFCVQFPVFAQSSATLSGTVSDPQGAAIVGASIKAEPAKTGAAAVSATTGPSGHFQVSLAAGMWRVTIAREGFESAREEFAFAAGQSRMWEVRMALARLSASVVVTAQALPVPAENSTAPVDIITGQDIKQSEQVFLAPMLSGSPGVNISRLGAFGGITSFFLDGGNSDFTKFLVNGVPVNEPGGNIDLSNYTTDNVDKIEIVHGASSALFGSDALTGVVQIFTHQGDTTMPIISLESDGGTFSTGHGIAQISGLIDRFDYSASASYFTTDGEGANDSFRDTSLTGNFGWHFSNTDTLRLALNSLSSDAGQPGQTLYEAPELTQNADLRNFATNLSWDFTTGEHWHHHIQGTDSYIREDYFDEPLATVYDVYNRAAGEAQSSYLFGTGAVSFGYVYEVENGSADGPHERRNNQAGYVEIRKKFGRRLTTTSGGRAEDNASFGTRVVPRSGLAYALRFGDDGFWGATRLIGSYGLGIKEPSFVQSYEADPCFPGNPALRPEQSTTFDAGVEQILASNRLQVNLDYFHNDFRDIVSFAGGPPTSSCPFGTGTFFNTDRARAYGTNASFRAKLTSRVHLVGIYSYDDSLVLVSPNAYDPTLEPGNRLFLRPLNSANAVLDAVIWRMNWNLAGYFVGRSTDSDFLGLGYTRLPGYFRLDLGTNFQIGHGVSALARVGNLLGREYQDALGYPAIGFNYRVGLKYTWGGKT